MWSRYGVERQLARAEAQAVRWEGRGREYEGRTKLRPQKVLHCWTRWRVCASLVRLVSRLREYVDVERPDVDPRGSGEVDRG